MSIEQLMEAALSLPKDLKLQLAQQLLESLDGDIEPSLEKQWIEEAKQRLDEIRNGAVEVIPGDEALAQVRQMLN